MAPASEPVTEDSLSEVLSPWAESCSSSPGADLGEASFPVTFAKSERMSEINQVRVMAAGVAVDELRGIRSPSDSSYKIIVKFSDWVKEKKAHNVDILTINDHVKEPGIPHISFFIVRFAKSDAHLARPGEGDALGAPCSSPGLGDDEFDAGEVAFVVHALDEVLKAGSQNNQEAEDELERQISWKAPGKKKEVIRRGQVCTASSSIPFLSRWAHRSCRRSHICSTHLRQCLNVAWIVRTHRLRFSGFLKIAAITPRREKRS